MAWQPESFTRAERRAAAKAVVRAQVLIDQLDRSEFGSQNVELIAQVYARVDDLLAMIYEDIYGYDASRPQPPSAS